MKFKLLIILMLLPWLDWAQKNTVFFHLDKITVKEKTVKDSTRLERYEQKAIQQFQLNGYVGITLADSVSKSNGVHYYYQAQDQFKKIELRTISGKRQKIKSNRSRDYIKLLQQLDRELSQLENNGYPFAAIKITKQKEEGERLILDYEIDSGDFFFIDKVHIKSEQKFHDKTIFNLIGLKVGDPYNESKIADIGGLLQTSKMYALNRPIEVLFRKGKAELFIYLKKERSSNADGYIGFQQDQVTGSLALNGYIDLNLHNSFNRAEVIDMNWKSNPDKTQNLQALLNYPFLFNTPLGIGGNLDLRKQDSTFIRTDLTINLSYYHPYFGFSIFNQFESSNTLRESAPTTFRQYAKNTIGATTRFTPALPQQFSWFSPEFFVMGGFFNYRNDTIDDNKQKVANSKYQFRYSHIIDIWRYFHLNNSVQFEGLTSSIELSRNELIYFGGLNTIRGFYELELSGKDIWSFRNQIEFTPVEAFSIFLLYDRATFHNNGFQVANSGGVGFRLSAENSGLEIIVANGVLNDNPFDFANTKIHIGFKSTF